MSERGKYIVIEGSDGTGKTTVANKVADSLREQGREVVRVDEPDSAFNEAGEVLVPIASELRAIIKNGDLARTALTNVLLFTASRRENWEQASQPALEDGADVVSARNYWSTLVYQGYGEGYSRPAIQLLTRFALGRRYMHPDHAFILDLSDEVERKKRIDSRGALESPDTFESKGDDFQQRLRDGYRRVARRRGVHTIEVDGHTPDQVRDRVLGTISNTW